MSNLSPKEFLKQTEAYYKNLEVAKKATLKVGLIKTRQDILDRGIAHELTKDPKKRRSWLKMPLELKQKEIAAMLAKQFKDVAENGKDAVTAMNIVGVLAVNIVKKAFETGGYGRWRPLKASTEARKNRKRRKGAIGSSLILVDTAALKNSVKSIVEK